MAANLYVVVLRGVMMTWPTFNVRAKGYNASEDR